MKSSAYHTANSRPYTMLLRIDRDVMDRLVASGLVAKYDTQRLGDTACRRRINVAIEMLFSIGASTLKE